jgi:hypothetical protein
MVRVMERGQGFGRKRYDSSRASVISAGIIKVSIQYIDQSGRG